MANIAVYYKRKDKWYRLADDMTMPVALSVVDSLRKSGVMAYVSVGKSIAYKQFFGRDRYV